MCTHIEKWVPTVLFNSLTFLIFLPIVWILYWFVCNRNLRIQNLLIVVASYLFYGWWDWRFLGLIAFTSLWAYAFGVMELYFSRGAKARLALSCVINLGILGYFKYYNFFVGEAVDLLNSIGLQAHPSTLLIILPVGISFYTFQALSYTIDVYRKDIVPTKDPIAFFAFVSFFPQLVAGPIERATNLLPQFLKPRTFDYPKAVDGCRQMLWGFFKKMVVADNCAVVANTIFNDLAEPSGLAILVGFFAFSIQIYGDFSGYSDIAIGCSRLFGIDLMRNFAFPYFSRDIAEFWRRWHISLSTWFRDYLYIPLGGSRVSKAKQVRNTFAIFLVSGFWHGANWTFILWGFVHACCFLPLLLLHRNRKNTDIVAQGKLLPTIRELLQMGTTFTIAMFAWGIFRAPDISTYWHWLNLIFCNFDTTLYGSQVSGLPLISIGLLMLVEWLNRPCQYGLARLPFPQIIRWVIYILLALFVIITQGTNQSFIYFQF